MRLEQLGKIVRQNLAGHAHRDALGAEHQEQRQFRRQRDRLLIAAVVTGHKLGQVVVENLRAGQFSEPALDVPRCGGRVAGENVAEVALAFDEIAFVDQHDQRVGNRRLAVRMILRAMAGDGRHLDEASVVLLVQRPQDAPLHRFQAVGEIGNGAVADDVGSVLQEAGIHAPVQRQFDFCGPAVARSRRGNVDFSNDFSFFLHGAHVVVGFWQMRLRGQGIERPLMRTMLAERRTPVLRGAWVRSGRFRAESVCGAPDTVKRQVFGVPKNRTRFSSDAWHDWCENCSNKLE